MGLGLFCLLRLYGTHPCCLIQLCSNMFICMLGCPPTKPNLPQSLQQEHQKCTMTVSVFLLPLLTDFGLALFFCFLGAKNSQSLTSWAWLPKFCRTFGVLQNLSSTSCLPCETFCSCRTPNLLSLGGSFLFQGSWQARLEPHVGGKLKLVKVTLVSWEKLAI